MRSSDILSTAALAVGASAATNYLGFNSGATLPDKSAKFKKDWLSEFTTAQNLVGAPGKFNSVRLYTNIQAYSEADPIEAFEAAIDTKTNILLGIWTSGTTSIDKEITALKAAVSKYGSSFTDLVIGMSIGSEDLYRDSATGVANKAGVGNGPDAIVNFINTYKKAMQGTPLAKVPVGHVDTWDVWGNATNKPVIDAIDWIGVDEYPYYENGKGNAIDNSGQLFDRAYNAVLGVAGDKQVWVTETGWPVSGPNWDEAVPSVKNAQYYWQEVGCRRLFNKAPTFWYNLRDSNPDNKQQFAITKNLSPQPVFDLTCPKTFKTPSSSSSSSSSASGSQATSTGASGSNTGKGSGTDSSPATTTSSASNAGTSAKPAGVSAGALNMIPAAAVAILAAAAGAVVII